jgi:hypothetical protein
MDVRCPHRKFGELVPGSADEGRLEIYCPSRWCGKADGVTVLHVFSTRTGELLTTRQFRTPKGRI